MGGTAQRGVEVTAIVEQGPGAKAGLRVGDLITRINGDAVQGTEVLRGVISSSTPGQVVDITVWRDGEGVELKVTLGEFPRAARSAEFQSELMREFGLSLRDIREGAVVWDVLEEMPATICGLERGQIIVSVEGTSVANAAAAVSAMLTQGLLAGKPVSTRVRQADGTEKDLILKTTAD